jgi:ABC-type glutathione transport system ATPase component
MLAAVAGGVMTGPLLQLEKIRKVYARRGGPPLVAVNGVDLSVAPGEIVALVGESGSGKSTLGQIALCLLRPDSGRVLLAGQCLSELSDRELRGARVAMQPIFQDPSTSFNPRRTVASTLRQALPGLDPSAAAARSIALLEQVGLHPARALLAHYPRELSGGQRQRLAIARALAMQPRLIIADEPLSGSDVSIRGQILNLLLDLQRASGVAYLMITHDISTARAFANRVAVMMQGEIVEIGPAEQVLDRPQHPYTKRLVAAVPSLIVQPCDSNAPGQQCTGQGSAARLAPGREASCCPGGTKRLNRSPPGSSPPCASGS